MTDILLLKKYAQSLNILYVEDETELNASVVRYLSKFFGHTETAYDGEEGLEKYRNGEFDIVLTDINMPKMNGSEMAKNIKAINGEQEIIILSAHAESDYFLDAIHLGVSDYIIKPIIYEQMNAVLYKVSNIIQMRKENKRFHESLQQQVKEQTKLLTDNYEQTIKAMVDLVESRDSYTGGHSDRVASYSKAIAQEMNLGDEECELIFRAGMLHDIGKVTTPDTILLKPGKLSPKEHDLIKNHVTVSYELLEKIPMYEKLAAVVSVHHERYDGHGYPKGLKGDEIPLLGQIMIVADAFDAMTTNRIYKARMSIEDALIEIEANSGTQFDPKIVPFACKVLSRVVINQDITQLPKSNMENERFAYFFHDSVTDYYNQEYLSLFLQSIPEDGAYQACVYFLKNFSQYNNRFDWEVGNRLLKTFADLLQKVYPDATLFRIQGDDFILISKELFSKECVHPLFLEESGVEAECYHLPVGNDFMDRVKRLERQNE